MDPAFRKDWEDVVLEGNTFEQMFTGKEVLEDVKMYTDWQPEIMSMYERLAHDAPKHLDRVSMIASAADVEG